MKVRRRPKIEKIAIRSKLYKRDGISKIEQLKPDSYIEKEYTKKPRYNYHQMQSIVEHKMAIDIRKYSDFFEDDLDKKYGFSSPGGLRYWRPDFWSEFQLHMFWNEVRNDQTNRLYIGMDKKKIKEKLKRDAVPEEMYIQMMFNRTFKHLASPTGWVNVDLWW